MTRPRLGLLVLDASALIDYLEADATVIRLISDHIGQVHVPLPLLREEIAQLTEEDCGELGLVVVEPTLELVTRAAPPRAGLSFHDRVCLLLAIDRGWTCVTNDLALRRVCESEGVTVLWGLEAIALLVDRAALTPAAAAEVGRAIHESNPRFITHEILERFLARIGVEAAPPRSPHRKKGK